MNMTALHCPFPHAVNKFEHETRVHTLQWIKEFQLVSTKQQLSKLEGDNYAAMTARFYLTATLERLCIVNDLLTLLFLIDDLSDNFVTKSSDARLADLATEISGILIGSQRAASIYGKAFENIWERIQAVSSTDWKGIFIADMKLLFEGISWERNCISTGNLPSLEEYSHWRLLAGGAHLAADLILFAEDIETKIIQESKEMNELKRITGRLGCWANDIFSYPKEAAHGHCLNIISVLQHEMCVGKEDALEMALIVYNIDMDLFKAETELSANKKRFEAGQSLICYHRDLMGIVSGNIEWSKNESKRYRDS